MIKELKIKITKLVDESFPGFVEFTFLDANRKENKFIEKIPVITEDPNIYMNGHFPIQIKLDVEILKEWINSNGERIALIKPLYHIESITGQTEFEVLDSQLVEI